jgi:hypothetical protein
MAFYITLTSSRGTPPDNVAMIVAIKTATGDATAVLISRDGVTAVGKKATAWTAPQIASAQTIFDTADELTPQVAAQHEIDGWPLSLKAAFLLVLDRVNLLGSRVSPPLATVTPAQFLQAIKDKTETL